MAIDWRGVRTEFPALAGRVYLNTATFGQMPRRGTEAVARHLARRDELACSDFLAWFDDADRLRGLLSRLIRCEPADLAFFSSESHALATVMNGLDWGDGDRVLALEGDFPNHLYAPAARPGIEFVTTTWDDFPAELERGARVVLLSTANYSTGFRPPLAEVARLTHRHGGLLGLDATQSLGALELDCSEIRPDFVAAHGYKWLLSPTGAAFLYISPELRSRVRPTVVGWRSDRRWRSVNELHSGAPEFVAAAERYEGGMLHFPALYGMEAAVAMMLDLGPEHIERRVLELAGQCRAVLKDAGGRIAYENTPILAARFEGRDAADLAGGLREREIYVSARHGWLRVSVHFYNDESDLDALAGALRDLR